MENITREQALQVLNLNEDVTEVSSEDIKTAYKRLAKEFHPDKNPHDPEATAKFQRLSEAYRFLEYGDDADDCDVCHDDDDVDLAPVSVAETVEKKEIKEQMEQYQKQKKREMRAKQKCPEEDYVYVPEPQAKKKQRRNRPKKKEPEVTAAPQKKTKEQLEAEERRRKQEMEEIAKTIEEQQRKDAEKEAKRLEKEKRKREELKGTTFCDYSFSFPSLTSNKNPAQSAPKQKSKKKRSKVLKDSDCPETKKLDDLTTISSRDHTEAYDSDTGKTRERRPSLVGKNVVKISSSHTFSKTVYKERKKTNIAECNFSVPARPQSLYERTRGEYRRKPNEDKTSFTGVSKLVSPPRKPVQNKTRIDDDYWPELGGHNPSAAASGAWDNGPKCDWTSGTFGSVPVSSSAWAAPAPTPTENVWNTRKTFYDSATPTNAEDEERMLQAALEMSRLQEAEEALRRQLLEEEREMRMRQQRASVASKEHEEAFPRPAWTTATSSEYSSSNNQASQSSNQQMETNPDLEGDFNSEMSSDQEEEEEEEEEDEVDVQEVKQEAQEEVGVQEPAQETQIFLAPVAQIPQVPRSGGRGRWQLPKIDPEPVVGHGGWTSSYPAPSYTHKVDQCPSPTQAAVAGDGRKVDDGEAFFSGSDCDDWNGNGTVVESSATSKDPMISDTTTSDETHTQNPAGDCWVTYDSFGHPVTTPQSEFGSRASAVQVNDPQCGGGGGGLFESKPSLDRVDHSQAWNVPTHGVQTLPVEKTVSLNDFAQPKQTFPDTASLLQSTDCNNVVVNEPKTLPPDTTTPITSTVSTSDGAKPMYGLPNAAMKSVGRGAQRQYGPRGRARRAAEEAAKLIYSSGANSSTSPTQVTPASSNIMPENHQNALNYKSGVHNSVESKSHPSNFPAPAAAPPSVNDPVTTSRTVLGELSDGLSQVQINDIWSHRPSNKTEVPVLHGSFNCDDRDKELHMQTDTASQRTGSPGGNEENKDPRLPDHPSKQRSDSVGSNNSFDYTSYLGYNHPYMMPMQMQMMMAPMATAQALFPMGYPGMAMPMTGAAVPSPYCGMLPGFGMMPHPQAAAMPSPNPFHGNVSRQTSSGGEDDKSDSNGRQSTSPQMRAEGGGGGGGMGGAGDGGGGRGAEDLMGARMNQLGNQGC